MAGNKGGILPEEILRYYELGLEADRLSTAVGELERVRTQEIIQRHLPDPPSIILDVGGGPGTYACWLSERGYEVHLVDPVPLHIEQARLASTRQASLSIASVHLGDARRLGFADECAHVVLLLGPLYHLTRRRERISALQEAHRVLKRGGLLFAVGISRFASTLAGLIEGHFQDPAFIEIAQQDLADGQHRNPTEKASYFTTSFFHHPSQLQAEVQDAGFSLENLLSIEGPAVFLQDLEAQWKDPGQRETILEAVRWLEGEPSLLGFTGHIAAIGRKPR
jgi:ubiquinone/menaquinone biosynthesis C-methylase UbiE